VQLFNEATDDVPVDETSESWVGLDAVTKPTRLGPNAVRKGENLWCDVDGLLRTRPGLRYNTLCNTLPLVGGTKQIQGAGYFDTTAREAILAVRNGKFYEVLSAGVSATTNQLAGPAPSASSDVQFAQLVDRMFYTDGTLRWSYYAAGWTHGTATQFSDASAMPSWKTICAHKFRLLAVEIDGIKLYASAIGTAHNSADWVKTDNIRIGTGEGDPIKAVLNTTGYLIVLNERTAWQIDTSAASVANWTIRNITSLTGCAEGKTAVNMGQDVLFLSRYGVVSLGALKDTLSINPSTTLSSPLQPYIDRINWSAITTAWATSWRDLYIIGLPIDSDTSPTLILTYNMRTQAWSTPWRSTLATADLGSGNTAAFTGWAGAVVSRFSNKQETHFFDTCGRLLRLDDTYEKDDNTAADVNQIVSWATLRTHAFGSEEAYKQPFWLELEWFNSTASLVQVNLVRDGLKAYPDKTLVNCEIIDTGLGTNNLKTFPIIFPLYFQPNEAYRRSWSLRGLSRFREASIQVVAQQGTLKLRTERIAAFVDTPALTG
jgi:hypothetical protein